MRARDLAAAAIFIGITFVLTRYTLIPIPATKGYFNFGEVAIYIAAIVFGPVVGALAGGLGSALADLVAAPQYAPFTLVIKGLEGMIVGRLAGPTASSRTAATIAGGTWMIAGYFLAQVLFAQTLGIAPTRTAAVGAALTEVPFNVVQVLAGVIVSILVTARIRSSVPQRLTK